MLNKVNLNIDLNYIVVAADDAFAVVEYLIITVVTKNNYHVVVDFEQTCFDFVLNSDLIVYYRDMVQMLDMLMIEKAGGTLRLMSH